MDLSVSQLFLQMSRSECMVYGRGKSYKLSYGSVTDEGQLHMYCSQLCVLVPLMHCGLGLVRKLGEISTECFEYVLQWNALASAAGGLYLNIVWQKAPVCVGLWPGNFSLHATVIYLLKHPGPYIYIYINRCESDHIDEVVYGLSFPWLGCSCSWEPMK